MNCPSDDTELEREDKTCEAMTLAGAKAAGTLKVPRSRGAEYFCPTCHGSWYYSEGGLRGIGSNVGPARDAIAYYAGGYVDENGQVW